MCDVTLLRTQFAGKGPHIAFCVWNSVTVVSSCHVIARDENTAGSGLVGFGAASSVGLL